MNTEEQQTMFKEMGVKTFYIGKSLDDPQRATVIFQGSRFKTSKFCRYINVHHLSF